MKRAWKAFWARFRAANGLDRQADRALYPYDHPKTPPPNQNLGIHRKTNGPWAR